MVFNEIKNVSTKLSNNSSPP